jgi:hypothetical protein
VKVKVGSSGRILGRSFALALVGVYVGLLLLAAACAIDALPLQAGPRHGHEAHHKQAHSLLCAWACQATSWAAINAAVVAETPGLVLTALAVVSIFLVPLTLKGPHRLRSPPSLSSSR